jgi:hypothetical protein
MPGPGGPPNPDRSAAEAGEQPVQLRLAPGDALQQLLGQDGQQRVRVVRQQHQQLAHGALRELGPRRRDPGQLLMLLPDDPDALLNILAEQLLESVAGRQAELDRLLGVG